MPEPSLSMSELRLVVGALLVPIGVAWTLTPWATSATALAVGIFVALAVGNPFASLAAKLSKVLLQASIVGLGFGLPVSILTSTGPPGVVLTSLAVLFAVLLGLLVGRLLRVERDVNWLVTIGTAICGGSAIAALGTAIRARAEAMAVALGSVFVLNAAALWAFPPVGTYLGLTQDQFGAWASIAIHDTASVVGAAATYGDRALEVATLLKLLRTLWIVPLVLGATLYLRRHLEPAQRPPWTRLVPPFILLFVVAALVGALTPQHRVVYDGIAFVAKRLFVTTLFLIGSSLTFDALRRVGGRPLLLAVVLWLAVSAVSLAAVRFFI